MLRKLGVLSIVIGVVLLAEHEIEALVAFLAAP